MDLDPQTVKQATPGILGAIGAIFFLRGPWFTRVGLIFPGGALSYYAAADVARLSGMSLSLAGFSTGILGMIVLAKIVETWNSLEIGQILGSLLRKWFGVQEK